MDRFEQLREEIKQWVRENLVGKKVYREELNDFVEFTWQGLKHDIGNNRKYQLERLEILKQMESILTLATYVGKTDDTENRADIKCFHYFVYQISELPDLRIVIKETHDKKFFYDHLFSE